MRTGPIAGDGDCNRYSPDGSFFSGYRGPGSFRVSFSTFLPIRALWEFVKRFAGVVKTEAIWDVWISKLPEIEQKIGSELDHWKA